MCTLVASVRPSPSIALVVAANRDEATSRPASPPFLWPGSPAIVAPRDDLAGGTWLGLNAHGLFVGITNRAGVLPDPTRRSRGALVVDALHAPSAAALHARLADLDPGAHNPFHLLYADRESAHLTWSDGHALHRSDLAPGLHVITERSFGAGSEARAALVRRRWADLTDLTPASLGPLLAEHAEDPFEATCVHADARGYGTRSSMILRLADRWADTRFLWAEGRPCRTPFVEQDALVHALATG
ncbi:MAG: NRDE family protein [Minicystis sp.]